ncbi:MAG: T9SS type A sorting domain-containing protein [Bacteroidia bacterium]|nr:T9SS type A sorting domain-containing protein [Bacteroidia bacterium]
MKKIFKIQFCLVALILSCSANILAQEILINLPYNSTLKNYYKTHSRDIFEKKNIQSDTLELPFFDDFSTLSVIPDPNRWVDYAAYVNAGYTSYIMSSLSDVNPAHSPPSIGVVTLDAIDPSGVVYSHLLPTIPAIADYLTSKPINLNYSPADSVYLFFYYQPTSVGNTPESHDSLILEFFSPVDSAWHHAWCAEGSNDSVYRKANVPIRDTVFLQMGFRFRFKNYASLGSNYEPSWLSNCDQWNLDYIYLDTNRHYNDTIFKDVGMLYPIKSILKDSLEAMPWKHFRAAGQSMVNYYINMIYRNIAVTDTFNVGRFVKITEMSHSVPPYTSDDNYDNAPPNQIIFFPRTFSYIFTSNETDSAGFEIKCYLDINSANPPSHLFRPNDTATYYQKFKNYYAYDDGSAENGYGISGEGTQNARLAYKFKCFKKDTLRGVDIYFNNTLNYYTVSKNFYLTVWNDNNGLPGDTLVSLIGQHPDSSVDYHTYPLPNPLIIDSGATFYIGMKQTTNDMLNIGFDRNRDSHTKLYYNISGTWTQSTQKGALMMRPLFGNALPLNIKNNPDAFAKAIEVYPNPSGTLINFIIPETYSNANIIITDMCGKQVYSAPASQKTIDVSNFPAGVYLLKISDAMNFSITQKIIVMH